MGIKGIVIALLLLQFCPTSEVLAKKSNLVKETLSGSVEFKEDENIPLVPFDPKIAILPIDFKGTNIITLYNQLDIANSEKNEFETKDAYRKRIQDNYPHEIYSFVKVIDYRLGFGDLFFNYDPEKQIMSLHYWSYSDGIKILKNNERRSTYEASNRFGATTIVTSNHGDVYGITPINKKGGMSRNISFKLSPEEAREQKSDLVALIVCKVCPSPGDEPKITHKNTESKQATMDSPYDHVYAQYFINVAIYEVWVFNSKTGVIYAKEIFDPLPSI
ncbi:MAG: hypothetical protein HGA59_01540 [Chlorobiaceae bacterium]|jgi:hypothetical protein|nr:hypothetical protein [Chlorobiaceae bacterium]